MNREANEGGHAAYEAAEKAAHAALDELEARSENGQLDELAWHSALETIWRDHNVAAMLAAADRVAYRMRRVQLSQAPGRPLSPILPPATFNHLRERSEWRVILDCQTLCGWFWRPSRAKYDEAVLDRLAKAGPRTLYALGETALALAHNLVGHARHLSTLRELVDEEREHRAARDRGENPEVQYGNGGPA